MSYHRFIAVSTLLLTGAYLDYNNVGIEKPVFLSFQNTERIQYYLNSLGLHRRANLICQYDGDMGDTLQRTGSYYTLLSYLGLDQDDRGLPLKEAYNADLEELTVTPGYYRRSNDFGHWSANPENTSRDQMISLQTAVVALRDVKRGREIFSQFLHRGFLNQNIRHNDTYPGDERYAVKFPDLPSPMQLSLLLRGLGTWTVYPIVFFLDSALMLDVTFFRRLNSRELWDSDIKNLPIVISANSYLPTPWSRMALDLYIKQQRDIERRVRYYNEPSNNGIPPLAELYILTLEELAQSAPVDPQSVFANQ